MFKNRISIVKNDLTKFLGKYREEYSKMLKTKVL